MTFAIDSTQVCVDRLRTESGAWNTTEENIIVLLQPSLSRALQTYSLNKESQPELKHLNQQANPICAHTAQKYEQQEHSRQFPLEFTNLVITTPGRNNIDNMPDTEFKNNS